MQTRNQRFRNLSERYELASVLEEILKQSDWQSSGVSQALFAGVHKDLIIETPTEKPSIQVLGNWLVRVGLKPKGFLKPEAKTIKRPVPILKKYCPQVWDISIPLKSSAEEYIVACTCDICMHIAL